MYKVLIHSGEVRSWLRLGSGKIRTFGSFEEAFECAVESTPQGMGFEIVEADNA